MSDEIVMLTGRQWVTKAAMGNTGALLSCGMWLLCNKREEEAEKEIRVSFTGSKDDELIPRR